MPETTEPLAAWQVLNRCLREKEVKVVLGGGLGLYMLQAHRSIHQVRTLIPADAWPQQRATSDVDVFLPFSLLVDTAQFGKVRLALSELGYEPSVENKFWQFIGTESGVYVDILTGPANDPRVKGDSRRVRPKGPKLGEDLHAHPTPEALALEAEAVELPSADSTFPPTLIAGPLSYLLMKLHTYSDRSKPGDRRYDREKTEEQAIDLFRIVAMMTREEFGRVRARFAELSHEPVVASGAGIVKSAFQATDSAGLAALRAHPSGSFIPEDAVQSFIDNLADLLPVRTG